MFKRKDEQVGLKKKGKKIKERQGKEKDNMWIKRNIDVIVIPSVDKPAFSQLQLAN